MQVVKVVTTANDRVFSQELATRCGDKLTLDGELYTLDHSSDGCDIFQNYDMHRGVVVNGRVMGATLVVARSDATAFHTTDMVPVWSRWTTYPELPPLEVCNENGIHVNNGCVKKTRKSKCEEETVPEEREEDSEEYDEYDDDEDDTDKDIDVVIE